MLYTAATQHLLYNAYGEIAFEDVKTGKAKKGLQG